MLGRKAVNACHRTKNSLSCNSSSSVRSRPVKYEVCRALHNVSILRSGHNKWSKIRHSKGALDSERARLFSRLSNDITLAAKLGGVDPLYNLRLSACLTSAKKADMPKSNIESAIKRATGRSSDGETQAVLYEGNLSSIGFMIDALTDKKTRTIANIKSTLKKAGGVISPAAFHFDHLGLIVVASKDRTLDQMINLAIEVGAEDVELDDAEYMFWTDPSELNTVAQSIKDSGSELLEARLQYRPKTLQDVNIELRKQVEGLLDALEADEDVVRVTCNMKEEQNHQSSG